MKNNKKAMAYEEAIIMGVSITLIFFTLFYAGNLIFQANEEIDRGEIYLNDRYPVTALTTFLNYPINESVANDSGIDEEIENPVVEDMFAHSNNFSVGSYMDVRDEFIEEFISKEESNSGRSYIDFYREDELDGELLTSDLFLLFEVEDLSVMAYLTEEKDIMEENYFRMFRMGENEYYILFFKSDSNLDVDTGVTMRKIPLIN